MGRTDAERTVGSSESAKMARKSYQRRQRQGEKFKPLTGTSGTFGGPQVVQQGPVKLDVGDVRKLVAGVQKCYHTLGEQLHILCSALASPARRQAADVVMQSEESVRDQLGFPEFLENFAAWQKAAADGQVAGEVGQQETSGDSVLAIGQVDGGWSSWSVVAGSGASEGEGDASSPASCMAAPQPIGAHKGGGEDAEEEDGEAEDDELVVAALGQALSGRSDAGEAAVAAVSGQVRVPLAAPASGAAQEGGNEDPVINQAHDGTVRVLVVDGSEAPKGEAEEADAEAEEEGKEEPVINQAHGDGTVCVLAVDGSKAQMAKAGGPAASCGNGPSAASALRSVSGGGTESGGQSSAESVGDGSADTTAATLTAAEQPALIGSASEVADQTVVPAEGSEASGSDGSADELRPLMRRALGSIPSALEPVAVAARDHAVGGRSDEGEAAGAAASGQVLAPLAAPASGAAQTEGNEGPVANQAHDDGTVWVMAVDGSEAQKGEAGEEEGKEEPVINQAHDGTVRVLAVDGSEAPKGEAEEADAEAEGEGKEEPVINQAHGDGTVLAVDGSKAQMAKAVGPAASCGNGPSTASALRSVSGGGTESGGQSSGESVGDGSADTTAATLTAVEQPALIGSAAGVFWKKDYAEERRWWALHDAAKAAAEGPGGAAQDEGLGAASAETPAMAGTASGESDLQAKNWAFAGKSKKKRKRKKKGKEGKEAKATAEAFDGVSVAIAAAVTWGDNAVVDVAPAAEDAAEGESFAELSAWGLAGLGGGTSTRQFENDKDLILQALRRNGGGALRLAPPDVQADKEVVLEAVKLTGRALQFASTALQADKEVVLLAVSSYSYALEFASETLRGNKEFVRGFMLTEPGLLRFASAELQADGELVREAVHRDGKALQYAAGDLQATKAVVLVAVEQNGRALKYASGTLRADRQVVLVAVKKDGNALKYASGKLQDDSYVALQAVKQTGCALEYASPERRADKAVVLEAVRQNGMALYSASRERQADKVVVLAAVEQDSWALQFASAVLQTDTEVCQAAR